MSDDYAASPNEPNPVVVVAPQPHQRRFQFSIATLLWLTTIAACLAAIWATYREFQHANTGLQTARDELRDYRYETGCLDLVAANPAKIHSRAIGYLRNRWAWRFYLPKGHRYRLLISTGAIPDDEFPDPKGSSIRTLLSGEYVLYAYAEPMRNGKWRLHSEVFDRGMFAGGRGAVEDDIPPLDQGFHTGLADLCPAEVTVEPDYKLQLLRCQIDDDAEASSQLPQGRSDGFLIWIEEAK